MNAIYNLTDFFNVLDKIAPVDLSRKMIDNGSYDNSGILVRTHDTVSCALFSLDLSDAVLKRAKTLGVDTVVTHHPVIYSPIKTVDVFGETELVAKAVAGCRNVISMHLNLDVAEDGIDACLAEGLGARQYKIVDCLDGKHGYGRVFPVKEQKFSELLKFVKETFRSQKIIYYGNKNAPVKSVASFCGGGASCALSTVKNGIQVDVVVTSDLAHHEILYLVNAGKNVIVLPHYVSEEYGFRKFYEKVNAAIGSDVKLYYFDDKRFR